MAKPSFFALNARKRSHSPRLRLPLLRSKSSASASDNRTLTTTGLPPAVDLGLPTLITHRDELLPARRVLTPPLTLDVRHRHVPALSHDAPPTSP